MQNVRVVSPVSSHCNVHVCVCDLIAERRRAELGERERAGGDDERRRGEGAEAGG